MGFLAEELGHFLDHARHAGHAADQNHLVDIRNRHASILDRGLAGLDRLLDQILDQRFQLGAGQLDHEVQGLPGVLVHRDERLVDFGLLAGRKLDLGFFCCLFQTLQRHLVQGQVNAMLFLELFGQVIDDAHVKVFTAKESIPVGGLHFKQTVVDLQNGDVEGAAAKVINRDGARFLAVKAIGQRRCGGFVDDAQHFQTGDLARVLGGLTLGVVEIGGHRDDGLSDGFTQVRLGGFFHLLQDESRNLAGRVLLAAHFDPGIAIAAVDDLVGHVLLIFDDHRIVKAAPDQTLDGKHGVRGVGDRLTLGGLADQTLVFGETDDRGRGARAFCVFDDPGLRAVHDGNARVGRPEVNTNDFGHECPFP